MTRPVRVMAIGWFGEGNLGDEAMLEGLLRLLDRALRARRDNGRDERSGRDRAPLRDFGDPAGGPPRIPRFRNLELVRASLRSDLVTLSAAATSSGSWPPDPCPR